MESGCRSTARSATPSTAGRIRGSSTHYFTGTHIAPATKPFTERVLLLDGVAHVDLTFASPVNVGAKGTPVEAVPSGRYRVQLGTTPGRLQLVNRASGKLVLKGLVPPLVATPLATSIQLNQPAGIWDANHHWRGSLHVHKSGNRLMLVDWVPIEKYVAAVVPNEVSASWPQPAVRTQAVAVRSYAYATRDAGRVYDATLSDQTYGPIEREAAAGTAAAVATKPQRRVVRDDHRNHVLLVQLGRPHLIRARIVGNRRTGSGLSQTRG